MLKRFFAVFALAGLAAAGPACAIDITMYYPVSAGGPIAEAYESLAAAFSKANGSINIKPVFAGNQVDALVKAQTAARGGNPPAMAIVDSTNVFTLIEDDMIAPISDFVKTDEDKKLIADIYPAFLANSVVGDKVWSLPFQRSTVIMYYNKDAFREAGDPFDAATALRLQQHIYSAGNRQDPAQAFRAFRGRDPSIEPMLRKNGLLERV